MYVPASFAISDEKILESFIERYDFATMTSSSSAGLVASHIPIMLRRSAGKAVLVGHVARANSHWRQFDGSAESLAIFQGPHAYVSPSWYATGPAVPTWNYSAVHVYGKPLAREDGDFTAAALRDLSGRTALKTIDLGCSRDSMRRDLPMLTRLPSSSERPSSTGASKPAKGKS